jgi:hypothetical protein
MKRIFSLISIAFILLQSCSSDDKGNDDNTVIADNFKPPYTVKYEVQFSTNQVRQTTFIQYSHESNGRFHHWSEPTGGLDYLTNNELNTVWSRSFLVTVNTNPLGLEIKTNFNPTTNAIVYFKIYVNNILVKDTPVNVSTNNNLSVNYMHGIGYALY